MGKQGSLKQGSLNVVSAEIQRGFEWPVDDNFEDGSVDEREGKRESRRSRPHSEQLLGATWTLVSDSKASEVEERCGVGKKREEGGRDRI